MKRTTPMEALLAAVVLVHLGITFVHGAAHTGAHVTLSPATMSFVFGIIVIGPLLGLILRWAGARRVGAWTVAATMAGAMVFGLVKHFLVPGADNVAQVAAQWQVLFGITAALLVVSEAFGSAVAVRCALLVGRQS